MPETSPKISTIADLFAENISRKIDEVIKVDALEDDLVIDEIREYYPTASIREQMREVLKAYDAARQGPTQDVGVWISGFFGAGKSSFAKVIGVLLANRQIGAQSAIELFSQRIDDPEIQVLLEQIREHLPTHLVMFDILKDAIAGAKEHPVTTVMYKALLRSLGYPLDLDLAELEINLEEREKLEAFEDKFEEVYDGRRWSEAKRILMTALPEASNVMHHLDPDTYPSADTWAHTHPRAEISPRLLAQRALHVSEVRAGGKSLAFVVDEIGQYTARDIKRIGDLQGVIESFSEVGRGKLWLLATSQEKLEAVIDVFDAQKSELVRLQDRFPHKVTLSPSDIREVASYRVLRKTAAGEKALRDLYQAHVGQLKSTTKVSGAIHLPDLDEDSFVRLYPLLPYQVDLLIAVVSGLRRQGTGSATMGGANRTIIKLAQQLLIHDKVGIGPQGIGALVTLDSVYDLIEDNVPFELRQEIDSVERHLEHDLALPVAKALALLQFAEAVYPTEENIASVLHPNAGAVSLLPEVRDAVQALINARIVRRIEKGLKIQSAAERTWDEERDSRQPTTGDRNRAVKEILSAIWGKGAQAPNHQLGGWKRFTGGLRVGTEPLVPGDVEFQVFVLDPGREPGPQIDEARKATQDPSGQDLVTWTLELSDEAEKAVLERFRSERMIAQGAKTKDEEPLLREEQARQREWTRRLRSEIETGLNCGRIFFQGSDRSPDDNASDPKAEAKRVLASSLEVLFHRFEDGSVKVSRDEPEAILKSDSLNGLPLCYNEIGAIVEAGGQYRIVTDAGPFGEILDFITERSDAGHAASGKEVEQKFTSAPFGWGLELIQLCCAVLLRAQSITLTAGGQSITKALSPEARKAVTNNTQFRALTLRPRGETGVSHKEVLDAAKALQQRFGHESPALTAESVANVIRSKLCAEIPILERVREALQDLQLPGLGVIQQGLNALREIQGAEDPEVVGTFLASMDSLQTAQQRAHALDEALTETANELLANSRIAAGTVARVLEAREAQEATTRAKELRDLLEKETFYEEIPAIRSATKEVLGSFEGLYAEAFKARQDRYAKVLEELESASGWNAITEEERAALSEPLHARLAASTVSEPWRQADSVLEVLSLDTLAAEGLLQGALDALEKIVAPQAEKIRVRDVVTGEIRSAEDLETALGAIRQAVEKALAEEPQRPVILG